jgi:hypothetical protein
VIETRTTSNANSNKKKGENLRKVAQITRKRGREEEDGNESQADRPKKKMKGASE